MNGTSASRVIVESGGTGVVAHVGLHALGCFADRLGLGDSLSCRIPATGERLPLHDRGKVLVHTALMLAGGGESCADIEHLRLQSDLFPSVPSDSTVFRTFHELSSSTREGIAEAMAEMRSKVWSRSSLTTGKEPVILDIDASLVEVHTDTKEHAAPTRKGGFGFHPMLCFADATGEMLSGLLQWNLTGGEIDGPSLTRPDSLPHERSPLSREWSGLEPQSLITRTFVWRREPASWPVLLAESPSVCSQVPLAVCAGQWHSPTAG